MIPLLPHSISLSHLKGLSSGLSDLQCTIQTLAFNLKSAKNASTRKPNVQEILDPTIVTAFPCWMGHKKTIIWVINLTVKSGLFVYHDVGWITTGRWKWNIKSFFWPKCLGDTVKDSSRTYSGMGEGLGWRLSKRVAKLQNIHWKYTEVAKSSVLELGMTVCLTQYLTT